MDTRYRIREHVLVYNRDGAEWRLLRGQFSPVTCEPEEQGVEFITLHTESSGESRLIEILLDTQGGTVLELGQRTGMTPTEVLRILSHLEKTNLIEKSQIDAMGSSVQERYDRHLRFFSLLGSPEDIQTQLLSAKVAVVGLGGIGSWLMYNLAGIGVGTLLGFDHDVVELSNLSRQILYEEADVGRPKAAAAAERLRAFNSGIHIETHSVAITPDNVEQHIPPDASVVVSTVFPTEHFINSYCVRHNIPVVAQGGGSYVPSGIIVMLPHQTGCFHCAPNPIPAWQDLVHRIHLRRGAVHTTTFGPIISLCANIMAIEVFKLITGVSQPVHSVVVNPFTWSTQPGQIRLVRRPDCPTCGYETKG